MKNYIITVLLFGTLLITGCSDKEEISLYEEVINTEANATVDEEPEKVLVDNKDDAAENTDDSRPFVVFVTGKVKKPGVYELNEGSRVIDAISMAGGYADDAYLTGLNLAELIKDEDMIYVPSIDEACEEGASVQSVINATNKSSSKDEIININNASKEELMSLPGIGESKAEKIINYRTENGAFSSPEGIMQISGIKDGLYNKIKDRICTK